MQFASTVAEIAKGYAPRMGVCACSEKEKNKHHVPLEFQVQIKTVSRPAGLPTYYCSRSASAPAQTIVIGRSDRGIARALKKYRE